MRYFMIDKVSELVVGERARGVKCVTLSDEVLHDHFPDHPILPGALIVEAASQLAGFLLEMTFNRGDQPVARAILAQIQEAKFYDMARPGDRLDLVVKLDSTLEGAARVSGEARICDARVMRCRLTFVMREVDSERLHEQRRSVYRLWTRDLKTNEPIR